MQSLVYDPSTTELVIRKNKKFIVFSNGANFSSFQVTGNPTLNSGFVTVNLSVTILEGSSFTVSGDAILEIT